MGNWGFREIIYFSRTYEVKLKKKVYIFYGEPDDQESSLRPGPLLI